MKTLFLDSGQGVLPFINEILKQNKKGEFIFFLDEEYFPYGNRSKEEVATILDNRLTNFSSIKDLKKVFIACNTLSTVCKKENSYPFEIDNILDFNLKHMDKDAYYLGTKVTSKYLKTKNVNVLALPLLAKYIENKEIKKIICLLKKTKMPKKIVLGCTHYPLIKFMFQRYSKAEVLSYEKEYIETLNDEDKLSITMITSKKDIYQKIINYKDIIFYPFEYISCRGDIR